MNAKTLSMSVCHDCSAIGGDSGESLGTDRGMLEASIEGGPSSMTGCKVVEGQEILEGDDGQRNGWQCSYRKKLTCWKENHF
jgi:hypothetical protein